MLKMPPPPPIEGPKPAGDTAALLRQQWEQGAADVIATAMLLARRGDVAALRLILERVAPLRRTVKLDLPRLESVADVPPIAKRLVELTAAGEITPEEASALTKVLDAYMAAVTATEHERRLGEIEKAIEASNGH